MLKDLVTRNRSYRRFDQSYKIHKQELLDLIELARLSATGGNFQPLRFMIYNDAEGCASIYPTLAWAGFLKDWDGPEQGERPSAYIVILADKNNPKPYVYDGGIAAQSMLLGAVEKGLGGCMIGSIQRAKLRPLLEISEEYEILLVLALGKPIEKVVMTEVKDNDIKYYRDEDQVHYVPKRALKDIVLNA